MRIAAVFAMVAGAVLVAAFVWAVVVGDLLDLSQASAWLLLAPVASAALVGFGAWKWGD